MSKPVPRSLQEYLDQLREELAGADPALIQDALYDAEEYLRAELDSHRGKTEEEVLATVATTYGAPEEVAEAYRNTEAKVQMALRTPRPKKRKSVIGRFFGVYTDPRAYTALLFMVLAYITGLFFFIWTVVGLAMSLGFMVLIIGLPFFLLYLGSIRLFSLVEGRIIEVLLGERMPRRPVHPGGKSEPLMERVKGVFTDPRTWSTILYFVLKLPLGVVDFALFVGLGAASLALILTPFGAIFHGDMLWFDIDGIDVFSLPWIVTPIFTVIGIVLLACLMHIAKGMGWIQGHLAKALLVKAG